MNYSRASCLAWTHRFNPRGITPHCRQILVPCRCNHHDILDPNAPDTLVSLQNFMVDMFRISHGAQEVGREVYTRLNRLQFQVFSNNGCWEEPMNNAPQPCLPREVAEVSGSHRSWGGRWGSWWCGWQRVCWRSGHHEHPFLVNGRHREGRMRRWRRRTR